MHAVLGSRQVRSTILSCLRAPEILPTDGAEAIAQRRYRFIFRRSALNRGVGPETSEQERPIDSVDAAGAVLKCAFEAVDTVPSSAAFRVRALCFYGGWVSGHYFPVMPVGRLFRRGRAVARGRPVRSRR